MSLCGERARPRVPWLAPRQTKCDMPVIPAVNAELLDAPFTLHGPIIRVIC
jgi:hypothetical protein